MEWLYFALGVTWIVATIATDVFRDERLSSGLLDAFVIVLMVYFGWRTGHVWLYILAGVLAIWSVYMLTRKRRPDADQPPAG